ncbi:uncharacterized protein EDB91DRAFT_1249090 [Suillus paluster]|uniref:uncharacterized protein n=1 Tax=Suillus paluster TaxID=48578 RepID=UPI001B884B2B|nr:uncharacterized protein EDB91DRAFT_1249090 [Suillus paluster]KAG1738915.1 hypothetical protein EDB91DRAFT_1249090 [Suillus paluster]
MFPHSPVPPLSRLPAHRSAFPHIGTDPRTLASVPSIPLCFRLHPSSSFCSASTSVGPPSEDPHSDILSEPIEFVLDYIPKLGARTRVRGAAYELKPSPSDSALPLSTVLTGIFSLSIPGDTMINHSNRHLLSLTRKPKPDITCGESSYQSLQPGLSLCEMGGHFGFQTPQGSPPIMPPGTEPDLQALNNSYVAIMMAKKDAKYRACSAVQSLAGGHQSSSKDSDTSGSGESSVGGEDDDYSTDSDNTGEREFGWAEVGQRHHVHPGFSQEPEPSPVHVTSTFAPNFDFQYSCDKDDMNAEQTLAFDKSLSNEIASEGSVSEALLAVLYQWDTASKQFEPDYWPIHKPDMAKLLYEDLSTWRSELKKNVAVIASIMPGLVPPSNIPPQEHALWVEGVATELKAGSKFLHNGMDEQFVCILDSLAKNGNGKSFPKFTTKEYCPTYTSVLKSLQNIMEHPYHGPKLVEQLQSWAEAGWQGYALVSNMSSMLTVFM